MFVLKLLCLQEDCTSLIDSLVGISLVSSNMASEQTKDIPLPSTSQDPGPEEASTSGNAGSNLSTAEAPIVNPGAPDPTRGDQDYRESLNYGYSTNINQMPQTYMPYSNARSYITTPNHQIVPQTQFISQPFMQQPYWQPQFIGQPQYMVLPSRPASPPPPPPPPPRPRSATRDGNNSRRTASCTITRPAEPEEGEEDVEQGDGMYYEAGEYYEDSGENHDLVEEYEHYSDAENNTKLDRASSEKIFKSLFNPDISLTTKINTCGVMRDEEIAKALARKDLHVAIRDKFLEGTDSDNESEIDETEFTSFKEKSKVVFEIIGKELREEVPYVSVLGDKRGVRGKEQKKLAKRVKFPTSSSMDHHFKRSMGALTGLQNDQPIPAPLEHLTPPQTGVKSGKRAKPTRMASMNFYQVDHKTATGWPVGKLEIDSDVASTFYFSGEGMQKTPDLDVWMEGVGDVIKILNQTTLFAEAQAKLIQDHAEGKGQEDEWAKMQMINESRAMALEDMVSICTNLMLNMTVAKREVVLENAKIEPMYKDVLRLSSPIDSAEKQRLFGGQLAKFRELMADVNNKKAMSNWARIGTLRGKSAGKRGLTASSRGRTPQARQVGNKKVRIDDDNDGTFLFGYDDRNLAKSSRGRGARGGRGRGASGRGGNSAATRGGRRQARTSSQNRA